MEASCRKIQNIQKNVEAEIKHITQSKLIILTKIMLETIIQILQYKAQNQVLGFKSTVLNILIIIYIEKIYIRTNLMFYINTPNSIPFQQNTIKSQSKQSMGFNPLNFILGQALRISLTSFTYEAIKNGNIFQTTDMAKSSQIIQIESDQNIQFNEEKNFLKNSQNEKEETKSREQVFTPQEIIKVNSDHQIIIVQETIPAENLSTLKTQSHKITEAKLTKLKGGQSQKYEDLCQLAILPQIGIQQSVLEKKLENLLKRQVTDWKRITRKQKREIRGLKL